PILRATVSSMRVRRVLFLFVLGIASLLLPARAGAQIWKLNDPCAKLVNEIKPLKPKQVTVADFTSPDSSAAPAMGHYFAIIISNLLRVGEGKHLKIFDHDALDAALRKVKISVADADVVSSLRTLKFESKRSVDIFVLGTVEKHDGKYTLEITP